MSRPVVQLVKPLRDAVAAGHPWIYDRAARVPGGLAPGDQVVVADRAGPIALGFVDPESPIRVRVLSLDVTEALGEAWAGERARQAAELRASDARLSGCDAYRVVHGENDFLPGLIVDRYADVGVVAFDGAAAEAFWTSRLAAVVDGARAGGAPLGRLVNRGGGRRADREGPRAASEATVLIEENGARFEVDPAFGQKTGFFLDQRDNRALVGRLAAGAEVLNLFCYTGGFSVHAALGGAARVTSVDISAPAIAAARRNFELNRIDPAAHEFIAEDAFAVLDRLRQRRARFDLVIVDPPSFAPSEKVKARALRAYRKLNEAALHVVAPGGQLVSCSCSSHVDDRDLLAVLAEAAARTGRRLRVTDVRGAGSDHPILPAFPEGRYLDTLFCAVS